MPAHRTIDARYRRLFWLATCTSACVGTPLPEPPDDLPAPDAAHIFGGASPASQVIGGPAICHIDAAAGAVPAGSDVWIIDLDAPGSAAFSVQATATGSFTTDLRVSSGDRIRIVARTDSQHSLPFDGQCTGRGNALALSELPSQALPCLALTPLDLTRVLSADAHTTASFTLTNHCAEAVSWTASLHFGGQGFSLVTPSGSVPAGGHSEGSVLIDGHSDDTDHADLVQLEVKAGTASGRYVLGVWSVSASKLGKD